jgi:hypothetical protein
MQHHHSGQLIPHARPKLTSEHKATPYSRIIQKVTGYDPAYMEGYTDEEGNYVPGEIEKAEQEGRRIEFKGRTGRQDKKAQEAYNKAYDEYENKKAQEEMYRRMLANGIMFPALGSSSEGEEEMKKGGSKKSKKYTRSILGTNYLFAESGLFNKPKKLSNKRIYSPHAKYYQEGGEQGCPEGYAFNPKTGECVEWNPDIRESYDQPTSFDPVGDVIYMNPNDRPEGMSDEEYAQLYKDQIEHEQLHRMQWMNDELKGFDRTPLRMPSTVDNQQHEGPHYYNRRGEEVDYLHNYWKTHHPEEAEFIPDDVIYNSETDPAMYVLPWTVEGEARDYEYATHGGMESLFPKKQNGGESDDYVYIDNLSPEEIEEYRKGGYIIEDISLPSLTKASYGHSVGNLIRKQNGGQTDYQLGDEVDEAAMKRLKKLGYTFEKL